MSRSPEKLKLAFDVGTTTLAASLFDAGSGERVAFSAAPNPQRRYGADVTARLGEACRSAERREALTLLLREGLFLLAADLCRDAGIPLSSVSGAAFAGNPAMEHFLLGLPVESIAFPPYRPLFTAGRTVTAAELGWDGGPDSYLFPLPGGYVGGDLVAFLATAGKGEEPALFIDIGTNSEIALSAGGRLYATSAAAGPAFEGGNIACGMAAQPGAISRISLEGERVDLETVGGAPPAGICGSAVIQAVAELIRIGIVDATGRLLSSSEVSSNLAIRLRDGVAGRRFVLHRDASREVSIGQDDIRQLQLAKGAVRAGIEVLFRRCGISGDDLVRVVLTGSFGAGTSPEALKTLGVFTRKMVDICGFVREGALAGAELALASPEGVRAVEETAASVQVIPLSGTPAFEKIFLEQMNFPPSEEV
jgi:uncharacterized 2Fe-2S/4Fe-4S cluster protein (DUF4445 family)